MKTAAPEIRAMVRLAVLQAPVSDREASPPPDPATLRRARVLVAAGKGGEIVDVQYVGNASLRCMSVLEHTGRGGVGWGGVGCSAC